MLRYTAKDDQLFQSWLFSFGLLKYQQANKQNNSETIIWLPGFCTLYWTIYMTFIVVFRLRCPFIRLTNLSKASRTMSLMSETLTEVTAHARAQLSPVNHCQNDKKPSWGQKAVERDESSHSDPVDLPTQLHWRSSEQFCLCYLEASVFLDTFCYILIIPNSSECFGSSHEMKVDQP